MNSMYPVPHLHPRFPLGHIVMTANAVNTLEFADVVAGLRRHARCDWGDLPPSDQESNDSALWGGGKLLSAYHGRNAVTFWVITEADRTVTTVLLPADY